jgi:hypothetical protein
MINKFWNRPQKLLGKSTDSYLNSQTKGAVWKQFLAEASRKLKFLIAFLALFWGNPFDDFHANFSKKNGSEKIDLRIKNDSIFDLDLTRKVDRDTTLMLNFHKES